LAERSAQKVVDADVERAFWGWDLEGDGGVGGVGEDGEGGLGGLGAGDGFGGEFDDPEVVVDLDGLASEVAVV